MSFDPHAYTYRFDEEGCTHARLVGGKGKGLGEMTADGLPVPPGFAVSASAYRRFLDQDNLRRDIAAQLKDLDPEDYAEIEAAAERIDILMAASRLPADVAEKIREGYAALSVLSGVEDVAVAVRSSGTAEDSSADSFAGEFETWVDIKGIDDVLAHVHRCYTSVYAPRVIRYALERGIDLARVEMAVVVQKTVRARTAGVMFTLDPISGDRSRIVLEASWGLGLAVVGGEVTPDRFTVSKVGLSVQSRVLGDKRVEYRRGDGTTEVPEERRDQLCLSDEEVVALAAFGKRLEKRHGGPQDIEFAVDEELPERENLLLLQCRPETVWSGVERAPAFDPKEKMMSWITSSITVPTKTQTSGGHRHG
ncbi:pyruvate,water dikinase [Microbacterium ginsengiterrae]|uniref:Phosphoenolpyruvate synthase n=1 Tax=Microbacterium ginsengiterrae TaxID=546115 RepID=A0A7W9CCN8_9MICO|nr:PEP/pyruvate-binding domain-containing protein [Microbacterium ginsengiterrae]MBB5743165.1 pyruvate,water dikinase [Microbacterium ginsengiterrae]